MALSPPTPTQPINSSAPLEPINSEEPQTQKAAKKKKKNKRKTKSGALVASSKPFPQFSKLPEKTQRQIFEWTCYEDDSSGPALARVSRKVRKWIEPLIYKYIVIDRFDRISARPDRLWRTFSDGAKTREFFKDHVKGILVNGNVDPVVTDLLAVCTNISTFACYAQGPLPDTILEKLASIFSTEEFPNLRHLSISGLGFEPDDIQRPFFQSLTHLAVDIGDNHESFPWQGLETHSHLTHILIDMHFELHEHAPEKFKSTILDILSHVPSTLRCLVVLVDWDKIYESSFQQKCVRGIFSEVINGKVDERVIVAAYTGDREEIDVTVIGEDPVQFLEYVEFVALTPDDTVPWMCPPGGARRDVWERAEDVLQQRKASQTQMS